MRVWSRRLAARQATVGLAASLAIWYAGQLVVQAASGEAVARYLFYYPTTGPTPGAVFAVVSHHLTDPAHLVGNVLALLVVGGYAEPRVGWKRVLGLVLGAGYGSIAIANLLAPLTGLWILAGTSGGILALATYAGLYFRSRARAYPATRDAAGLVAAVLLLTVPLYALTQAFVRPPHTGHLAGAALGALWAAVEYHRSDGDFGPASGEGSDPNPGSDG